MVEVEHLEGNTQAEGLGRRLHAGDEFAKFLANEQTRVADVMKTVGW